MPETTYNFDQPFETGKEEGSKFDLIPSGKYKAEAIDASVSPTKNKKGQMLNLSFQITQEGEYQARYVFSHILFQHESAEAQRIGRQKIKDLCVACGITENVTDVTVFCYKPILLQVGVERDASGEYPDKNKVARFLPLPPPAPENDFHSDPTPGFDNK